MYGGGQINVKLPNSTKQIIDLPDDVIAKLNSVPKLAPVSTKPMKAIGSAISPGTDEGTHAMMIVNEYLESTEIHDLGLIQTILHAAQLQIGTIKECTTDSEYIDNETNRRVISSKIIYYDYSVSINALGNLDIQCDEKEIILKCMFADDGVMCHFDDRISCQCSLIEKNTEEFLKANSTFCVWETKEKDKTDCIRMKVYFGLDKSLRGSEQDPIQKQGDANEYPILQTIALILKAASMVQAANYQEFVEQFTNNLTSFSHPRILCMI